MKPLNAGVLLATAALAASPSGAFAYPTAQRFTFPAAGGGGGGRHFTGSPGDSYTCTACHSGGLAPVIDLRGVPSAGYVPAAKYEIIVDWSDDIEHISAAVEVTDLSGKRAGSLRLPTRSELVSAEHCNATSQVASELLLVAPDGEDPSYCNAVQGAMPSDCRQVAHANDCQAQRLRVLWTAPSWDVGPVWFAGAAVLANGDSTNTGDGVTEFGRMISAPDQDDALTTRAGCSVGHASESRGHAGAWLLGLLGLCSLRRRRGRLSRARG